MTDDFQRRSRLTRYLLAQVSQEEREEIEEDYLHDDDLFEELVAAENDLIDDYARGKLVEAEKRQFETYFLSAPERRERVRFARSLIPPSASKDAGIVRRPTPVFSALTVRMSIAAGLLVLVAAFTWMVMVNWKLRDQLQAAHAAQANAQGQLQELHQQVADLRQTVTAGQNQPTVPMPPPGSATLSLALVPDLNRGHSRQVTLHLAPGISHIVLLLRRENAEPSSCDVALETAEGSRVWQAKEWQSQVMISGKNQFLAVEIPPNTLKHGDYVLRLLRSNGGIKSEELGVYSFRVIRP